MIRLAYANKEFELDINFFRLYSNYPFEEEKIKEEPIYLFNEFDQELQHPEETIDDFINFFQTGEITITPNNVFSLQFLSKKFYIPTLSKITEEYINNEENEQKILNEIFSHPQNLYMAQENYICHRIEDIITDDRLFFFIIPQLYRIFSKHSKKEKLNDKIEKGIIEFLIQMLKKEKKEAFVLISLINFSQGGRKHFYLEVIKNIDNIGLNFIETNLIRSIIEKSKEEVEIETKKMRERIKEIETFYEKKFEILEKKIESISNDFSREKEENRKEMKEQELFKDKQIEHLKTVILEVNNFYSNPSYEMFNKLQSETQKMIISNLQKQDCQNQLIYNIYNLVNFLMTIKVNSKHQFDNDPLIYIETKDNKQIFSLKEEIEKIIIPSSMIKVLKFNTSNEEGEFINAINNFDVIYTDIEYPSSDYQQLFDNVNDIKKLGEIKLKMEIRITKIDPQERPFQHNEYVESIIIERPNDIIPGGFKEGYFELCSKLSKVTIPDSVTKICGGAFYSCCQLKEINIPMSVNIIEGGAFAECSSLTTITIPSTIKEICNDTFSGCTSLTTITIPQSVNTIGNNAFNGCTSLTKITIPSTIQTIGENCFEGCTSIELSEDMNEIPNSSFKGCHSLKEIIIPSTIKKIGNDTFNGCTSLTTITIPQSVNTIGNNAFSGCTSLTKLIIPSTVQNIGENCFEGCIGLKQVMIDLYHTNIEKNTFNGCLPLKDIITRTSITENTKSSSLSEEEKEEITISFKQTEILFEMSILESPYFSSHISEFKEIIIEIRYPTKSFENIYQLINDLKKKNPNKVKISIIISGIESTDYYFRDNKDIDIIKLDSNIKNIKGEDLDGSFMHCSSLTQITIPSSVTSIGDSAFFSCSSLVQITIPLSVTSIGVYAFRSCSSLTQVTIPLSVTSIGSSAFSFCLSLKQVTIPSSITSIEGNIFTGCKQLEKIQIIPNQNERIRIIENNFLIYKSSDSENYDTLIFVKNNIKAVNIPSFIKYIGKSAFNFCSSLTQITIPSSVTSIGTSAFRACSSLTQVTIPSSVTSIGNSAFRACSSLTQITIPSSINNVGRIGLSSETNVLRI